MTTTHGPIEKSLLIEHPQPNWLLDLASHLRHALIASAIISVGMVVPSHANSAPLSADSYAGGISKLRLSDSADTSPQPRAPVILATIKNTIAADSSNGFALTAIDSGSGKLFSDIWLTATMTGPNAAAQIVRVRFTATAADGRVVTKESTGASHTVALRGLSSMRHSIRATAFTAAGFSIDSGVLTIDLRRRPAMLTPPPSPPPPPPPPPPANIAPIVNVTSPAANANVSVGASVTVSASATDADGSIAKVEFFVGTTKLGEDTTLPYSFTWIPVAAGTVSLTARATDNRSASTSSAQVTVTVNAVVTPPPPPLPPISSLTTLPIEVIGVVGTEVSVVLNLTASEALQAERLWLQTHNVRYAEKASVKINDAAWVNLNNTTVTMTGTSAPNQLSPTYTPAGGLIGTFTGGYGGIGGTVASLKMTLPVPASTLVGGLNTIRFRFNAGNGLTIGYRVLNLNLLDKAGQRLLPPATFQQTDPATWTVPANNSSTADIAIGRSLWSTASLKANSGANAPAIIARCGDCHTQNGADLKYFGYSNKSIIERAQFHGLTQTQGNQIASYIRTLPVKAVGRPWNPPYQPGPGLTSKPNDEWAAGAGLDNVLDEDWDTIKAIFPDGVKREALMIGDTNKFKRFAMHDTPIAFQLPDWNHWLPEVHPYDAFGKAGADSTENFKLYKEIRQSLEGKTPTQIKEWFNNSFPRQGGPNAALPKGYFAFTGFGGKHFPSEIVVDKGWVSITNANRTITSIDDAKKVYSAQLWKMVKHVELHEEFNLTGMGPETSNVAWAGFDNKNVLPRMWVGAERAVFDVSPFLSNLEDGVTGSTSGNNRFNYNYLSNAWYQLQLILNTGQRTAGGHRAVDFGYAFGFLQGFDRYTNFSQAGRNALWAITAMDDSDSDKGPNQQNGWTLRRTDISNVLGYDNDNTFSKVWLTQPTAEAVQVRNLLHQVQLEKSATWLPIQYFFKNINGNLTEGGSDLSNQKDGVDDGANFMRPVYVLNGFNSEGRNQAESTHLSLTYYKTRNIFPAALQNGYANWAQAIWPGLNGANIAKWEAVKVARTGAAPMQPALTSAAAATVSVLWQAVAGATSYNVKRSDSANGPFMTVAYFRTGASYTDTVPVLGRTYFYRISSNSSQNATESPDSAAVAIAR